MKKQNKKSDIVEIFGLKGNTTINLSEVVDSPPYYFTRTGVYILGSSMDEMLTYDGASFHRPMPAKTKGQLLKEYLENNV